MIGDVLIVVAVILIALALAIVCWLAYQNVQLAHSAQDTNRVMVELVAKQSAIIAAADAMTYQAIQVMDHPGGYDEGSNTPEIEESPDEFGYERDPAAETGFSGDPFVGGNIFTQNI